MTEQAQMSLGGPGRSGHPGLEELAALADGRCRSADAARVRAHLASCEECYEVFLETLQLLDLEKYEILDIAAAPLPEEKGDLPVRQEKGPTRTESTTPVPGPGKTPGEVGTGDAPPSQKELPEKKGGPGRVLPFPFNEDMKPHYRWAAAALVVVALGFGLYYSHLIPGFSRPRSATPSVAGLAASAGTVPRVGDLAWGERTRGMGSHKDEPSFRLGVELLNLQVALASKDLNAADAANAAVNGLLDSIPFLDPKSKDFYIRLRSRMPKQALESFRDETAKEANNLHNEAVDKLYFELGSWAEAGRFAAYSKNLTYFAKAGSGDFLSRLRKDGEVPPEVKTALETIDAKLAAPGSKDYVALGRAFDQILKVYYAEGERGGL